MSTDFVLKVNCTSWDNGIFASLHGQIPPFVAKSPAYPIWPRMTILFLLIPHILPNVLLQCDELIIDTCVNIFWDGSECISWVNDIFAFLHGQNRFNCCKVPDFAILTKNGHTLSINFLHSNNVFVAVWSNDHRHMCHVFEIKVKGISKDNGILTAFYSQIAPFVDTSPDFAILITTDHTIFTNFSRSYQLFVKLWSNDHRHTCQPNLRWTWNAFQEIMGSLHPYIAKNALFVEKSPDFPILTKNDHTIFTNSSHSNNVFVIAWSNDHRHLGQSISGWRWNVFHEIMWSLHFSSVDKSSDFVNFTENNSTFFTNF